MKSASDVATGDRVRWGDRSWIVCSISQPDSLPDHVRLYLEASDGERHHLTVRGDELVDLE